MTLRVNKLTKDSQISSPISSGLLTIADRERAAATDFVSSVLRPDARVSVYLYKPVTAAGLRAESPGALFDIGPLPPAVADTDREYLYQCAEAGRDRKSTRLNSSHP
jgi:hypothetical protein